MEMKDSGKTKEFIFLILAFFLAISSRLWLTIKTMDLLGQGDPMYLLLARNISEGKPYLDFGGMGNGYWFQPGYSAVIAFLNIFIHDFVFSSQLVSVITGSLVIFPLFYLAKRLFGLQVAYLSSCLIIFYPALTIISSRTMVGPLFTFLFIVFVYLGYMALEGKKSFFLLSGIIIGFSFLVRETGLVIGIILGAWIGITSLKSKDRKYLFSPLIFVLGILLVISPWLIYLRIQTGEWTLVPKTGYNLCLYYKFKGAILNESATGFIITEESKNISLPGLIVEVPWRVLKHAIVNGWKLYREIIPRLISFLPIGLLFLGLFDFKHTGISRKSLYMLSFFVPFFILYPIVAVYHNYFTPLLPLAIIWMARGMVILNGNISPFFKKFRSPFYIIIFIFLFLSFGMELKLEISKMRRIDNGWSQANKEVGLWIKKHKDKERPFILSRRPEPVFFAGGKYVFLPQEDLERTLKFARHVKADYIILDKAFAVTYPMLGDLFISTPPSLKLLYRYSSNNQEMLVFGL